jgi:hypothetical protein
MRAIGPRALAAAETAGKLVVQQSHPNSHLWGGRQNANEGQDAVLSLNEDKDQGGGMGRVLVTGISPAISNYRSLGIRASCFVPWV